MEKSGRKGMKKVAEKKMKTFGKGIVLTERGPKQGVKRKLCQKKKGKREKLGDRRHHERWGQTGGHSWGRTLTKRATMRNKNIRKVGIYWTGV